MNTTQCSFFLFICWPHTLHVGYKTMGKKSQSIAYTNWPWTQLEILFRLIATSTHGATLSQIKTTEE